MADPRFFNFSGAKSLAEIIAITESEIYGDLPQGITMNSLFSDVSTLAKATSNDVAVLHNRKYLESLESTNAGIVLIEKQFTDRCPKSSVVLVSASPYRSHAMLANSFYPDNNSFQTGTKTNFSIHPTAKIMASCELEAGVIVGENAEIGENSFIGSNTVIGKGVIIGDNCKIAGNVTITHALIGNNVILHTGVRVGQAGFGFHIDKKGHCSVPQLGRVIIHDGADIGANTTIDRGSGDDTIIGAGTRIDNLVMIAHNVQLGKGCVIVAQVGISGSTKIGDYSALGGQAGVGGHLNIGKGVQIAMRSVVIKDIADGESVGGIPAVPIKQWHRQTIAIQKLGKTRVIKNEHR